MTIHIGVIGTGAIGREHIRRCSTVLQNARVVALNDINRDHCQQIVNTLTPEVRIYDDASVQVIFPRKTTMSNSS